jgi:soluble lytic murein transglycosylase-like protein
MKKNLPVWMVILAAVAPAVPLAAQVRLTVNSEGRKVIFNEAPAQRARRFADHLVPVPDSELKTLIDRHSEALSLDPKLVHAVIQVESGFNQWARSHKGAMGLMQLIPATANRYQVQDPYDADDNMRGGTQYLRHLIDRFPGRLDLAVAAYNAGPGAVERYNGIPPYSETRDYVRRVLTLYNGSEPALSLPGPAPLRQGAITRSGGRKPRIVRNSENRIVVTTALDALR